MLTTCEQIQNIEMRLYNILVTESQLYQNDVVQYALQHIDRLAHLNLMRAASNVLLIICIDLHNAGQKSDVWTLYNRIETKLNKDLQHRSSLDTTQGLILTQLTAKTAWFVALRGKVQRPALDVGLMDMKSLQKEIEELSTKSCLMTTGKNEFHKLETRLINQRHLLPSPPLLRSYKDRPFDQQTVQQFHTEAEWQQQQNNIRRYLLDKNVSHEDAIQRIAVDHGFTASYPQWQRKIQRWDLDEKAGVLASLPSSYRRARSSSNSLRFGASSDDVSHAAEDPYLDETDYEDQWDRPAYPPPPPELLFGDPKVRDQKSPEAVRRPEKPLREVEHKAMAFRRH